VALTIKSCEGQTDKTDNSSLFCMANEKTRGSSKSADNFRQLKYLRLTGWLCLTGCLFAKGGFQWINQRVVGWWFISTYLEKGFMSFKYGWNTMGACKKMDNRQ